MNVNPCPEPFLLCECSVCHLNRNLAILLPPSFDQKARVCPPPITINNPKFSRQLRMRLDEKGLEQPLIRFNLTLKFLILLRPQSRLVGIRNDVI
jgi:hypothetical protein